MAASDNVHPEQLQMFMRPQEIFDKTAGSVEVTERYREQSPSMHQGLIESHMKDKLREAQRPGSSVEWGAASSMEQEDVQARPSLADHIAQHGVEKPIILSTQGPGRPSRLDAKPSENLYIGNGHHRLASAQFAEQQTGRPQYVPVVHDYDFMGSRQTNETFGTSTD